MNRVLFIAVVVVSQLALAADQWTTPFQGVRRLERATSNQRIHAVVVDLSVAGVKLQSTASSQRGRTPSSYARLVGAQIAINADFFNWNGFKTSGLAMGNGAAWPDTSDSRTYGTFAFDTTPLAPRVELQPPEHVMQPAAWMKGVVSGRPRVLAAGQVLASSVSVCANNVRHPRTAIGLSADKKKLFMVVVDGRSSVAIGMTCSEVGALLKSLGANEGMNLDGGGSSAMYVQGFGTVNRPSDGQERVVGNHLAVFAKPTVRTGIVKGAIMVNGATTRITGAVVRVSNGMKTTTSTNGLYDFTLPVGTYTITASAPGFAPASVKRTITASTTIWGSISLKRSPTADFDKDGVLDSRDNCARVKNASQANNDRDAAGDACDGDDDNDTKADEDDNCPMRANTNQVDSDGDGVGDVCDSTPGTPRPVDAVLEEPLDLETAWLPTAGDDLSFLQSVEADLPLLDDDEGDLEGELVDADETPLEDDVLEADREVLAAAGCSAAPFAAWPILGALLLIARRRRSQVRG